MENPMTAVDLLIEKYGYDINPQILDVVAYFEEANPEQSAQLFAFAEKWMSDDTMPNIGDFISL